MSWQVQFRAGVWLPQIEWWLDAHFPVARSFVSHAHSDHIAPHGEILCSAGTSRLLEARMPAGGGDGPGSRIEHVLPFGQTEPLLPGCAVTLQPAGHIYGSAQCLLAHETHGTLLYTGDFKLRPGRSSERCATPQADVLIMETTFGRPHYVFPPTEKTLRDIAAFCHACIDDAETPVLLGYSLGKSQELLCGLAEEKLPVMLHPQTFRLTRIYEELGIGFPAYRQFSEDGLAGHVVICPPQVNNSSFLRRIPRRRTAMITGWAMDPGAIYRYQCDAAFPLSDHADFSDLLRFVEAVQPKRVLTLHGFAQDFAVTLRERGIDAWAISEENQLELGIGGRAGFPIHRRLGEGGSPPAERRDGIEGGLDPRPTGSAVCEPGAVNCFSRFAAVAEQVKATPKKLEKVELLRSYLAELAPDDAARAALFFTARPFPQSDGRVLTMGWAVIKRAVLDAAGMTEADYRAAYHRFADAGDAAEALLASRPDRVCHVIRDKSPGPPVRDKPRESHVLSDKADPESSPGVPENCHVIRDKPLSAAATDGGESCHVSRDNGSGSRGEERPGESHVSRDKPHAETSADKPEARHELRDKHDPAASGETPGTCHVLRDKTAASGGVTLGRVAEFFAEVAAARGPAAKLDLLQAHLAELSPLEAKYVVKIITSDLRIGLKEGLVEEAIAAAAGQPPELVREANMLAGDIAEVTRAARNNALDTIRLRVFNPLQFMLASPEPTAAAILERLKPPVWLEEKYDGIRCQVHKQGERVELYSRDLKRITGQFPDLARAAQEIAGDFIGDGELLAWRDGRALPFAELQKRLGRKGDDFFLGAEIPVSLSMYDLLWLDGRALLKEPLHVRRDLLHGLLDPNSEIRNPKFLVAPVQQAASAADIEAAFLAARQRGNEGLMAKDPNSIYTPGRRGLAWLKLKKAYATLDVVVVGVEYGHGKRRGVLSDYTFAIRDEEHDNRLLTVGKAYSGLTDVEIAQLTEHFLASTTEVHGRFRAVVPDTILEVAFDSIQASNRHQSGFALRFPRIARIRTDKTVAEIDTLATCRRLANASFADATVPRAAEA